MSTFKPAQADDAEADRSGGDEVELIACLGDAHENGGGRNAPGQHDLPHCDDLRKEAIRDIVSDVPMR